MVVMEVNSNIKNSIKQSYLSHLDWYYNGGIEKAKLRALKALVKEINRRGWKDYKLIVGE